MNSSCQFWNQKVTVYSNFASLFSAMKDNSSVFFLSQTFILWIKRAHRSESFTLLGTWVKNHQIYYVIFESTSQFFFKICIALITLLYFFFVETVHDLDKRSPSKCKISDFWLLTFLTFDCFCWKYIKIFTKKVQRSYVSLP